MRRISIIQILLLLYLYSTGQTPVGSWSDHLVYNTANCLAIGIKQVYASTGSSIIAYNKEFAELKKMSPITGLTETGIVLFLSRKKTMHLLLDITVLILIS